MRVSIALITCLLAGCASEPTTFNSDPSCDKLAWYARSVATLKDIGMDEKQIQSSTLSTTKVWFQVEQVRHRVYEAKEKTPADIYVVFYAMCINNGFDSIIEAKKEDSVIAINPVIVVNPIFAKEIPTLSIFAKYEMPPIKISLPKYKEKSKTKIVKKPISPEKIPEPAPKRVPCFTNVGHC